MADIKQFVTPDNLGPDFEQDATAKEIKVNIDGVTIIRNADGKLEAAGDGVGVSKEYVDDLTAIDGVTIIRNAEGELVASGGDGDSVVYNITELTEGAEAPKANAIIIDMVTDEEVEGPDPTGCMVAIGAGAEANGLVFKLPEGGGYVAWRLSLAIGGSSVIDSEGNPMYVPASSEEGGIAIFGRARDASIAIGHGAEATGGEKSIAIGEGSKAGRHSVSIGGLAVSQKTYSVAIGGSSNVSEDFSTAIGMWANASHRNSVAIGSSAKTSKSFQVSIATLNETTHLASSPRLLSGVKAPKVGQDAANKEYVDNYIKAKVEALPEDATLEDLITALKS